MSGRRGVESKFVYPRSIVRDVERVLADARSRTWCDAQLQTIDAVIDSLQQMFIDHGADGIDVEKFATRACKFEGRAQVLNINTDSRRNKP